MKISINTSRLVNAAVILIVIVLGINVYSWVYHHSSFLNRYHSDFKNYWVTNRLPPIDPPVPTNIPFDQYQRLKARLRTTRDLKNGDWLHSGGVQFGYIIGTDGARFCDTCTTNHNTFELPGIEQSYIMLPGWKLKTANLDLPVSDSVMFFVEHGQSYIRKPAIDKIYNKPNGITEYKAHLVDVPVRFRYNRYQGCLLIPVSASVKNVCTYIFGFVAVFFISYAFFLIAEFLKIIIDISKGLSFTTANIKRLRLIALSLLSYRVVLIMLTLIVRLVFHNYFNEDVIMNPAVWESWWIPVGLGIIFLLLFKAFRQGKMFKEEVELTV